jgi:hypothetical protein
MNVAGSFRNAPTRENSANNVNASGRGGHFSPRYVAVKTRFQLMTAGTG